MWVSFDTKIAIITRGMAHKQGRKNKLQASITILLGNKFSCCNDL